MKKALVLFLSSILVSACFASVRAESAGELKIKIFKVGKADAILLRTENHTVLIDTAEEDDSAKLLDYLSAKGVSTLDYMIITHFDKDHIGSAAAVADAVTVISVLQPSYKKEGSAYETYSEALEKHTITPRSVSEEMTFTLDQVSFTVIPSKEESYAEDEDDDFSLVVRVQHGSNSFLFAGDIRSQRMEELMASYDLSSTFLKVPNHGINDDKSMDFLKAVSPGYAVISCSEKNPASGAILADLQELGTIVYQTRNGSIAITSDGNAVTFKQ